MEHSKISLPSPYDSKNYQKRKSASQLRIMTASQQIRERNGWREYLGNDEAVDNWMDDAVRNGLRPGEFKAVLEQLKHYNSLATGSIEVGAVEGTRQADNLISKELKTGFVDAVTTLLDKPYKKDYYPGTNDLVINLLDPSLYCYVSGVTRIIDFDINVPSCLPNIGNGEATKNAPPRCGLPEHFHFQLLPAEFHVNETIQVKINSYINNLHPNNDADLYALIENIFACFVPLFDGVLDDLLHEQATEILNKIQKLDENALPPASTKIELRGRDIQVIVKVKTVELTPEKAEFKGGDWHIEGAKDEHIVATGIYCYHNDNITESRLYANTKEKITRKWAQ